MSIASSFNENDKQLIITVIGNFDYSMHRELRDAYKDLPAGIKYIVDMNKAEHLDSSALGMLLLLRDHAGSDGSTIQIRGCRQNVKKIFEIAHFDRLFDIS